MYILRNITTVLHNIRIDFFRVPKSMMKIEAAADDDIADGSTSDVTATDNGKNVIIIDDDDNSSTGNGSNVVVINDDDNSSAGDVVIADNGDTWEDTPTFSHINGNGKRVVRAVDDRIDYNPMSKEREITLSGLNDALTDYSDIDIEKVAAKYYLNEVEGFEAMTGSNNINDPQSEETNINDQLFFFWVATLKKLIDFELNTRR